MKVLIPLLWSSMGGELDAVVVKCYISSGALLPARK
jgi:hypothetical protein